jgi:hypothetical protein
MTALPFRLERSRTEGAPGTGWHMIYRHHSAPADDAHVALWLALEAARAEVARLRGR